MQAQLGVGRRVAHELKRNWLLYAMTVPGLLFFILFCYVPMTGIVLAFKDYNMQDGIFGSPWVGLDNFKFFFSDTNKVYQTTFNTIYLNLWFIVCSLIFQMGSAILLNEIRQKTYKKITQSVIFLPYFLSWVVIGGIVYSLFSNQYGVINQGLEALGLERVSWYTSPQYWRLILVLCNIWKWTGYGSVIYLAAIMGIDPTYYEAAIVDGASKRQQILHITIPLLKPTAVELLLMSVGRIFFGDFVMIYGVVRDNGILLEKVEVIDTYVYRAMRTTGDFSFTSAVGIYQSFFGLTVLLIVNAVTKRINDGNGLF